MCRSGSLLTCQWKSEPGAIRLAAFENDGLNRRPTLFTDQAPLVWSIIASLYIGNFMLLVLNLPMARVWVELLSIRAPYLYGGILVFSLVGVWGMARSWVDLVLLAALGLVGYLFRCFSVSVVPALIGLILGPMAELQLRRAMAISQGDLSILVTSPVSAGLLVAAARRRGACPVGQPGLRTAPCSARYGSSARA